ncbi:MAG: tetratricopeptide repeat protein, partial [Rhodospirillales bacterium]|nr:tetratricopeptide repeat protein [Acetobacter sp.]
DIKPSNVLFTEEHEPVVTDFGLAKPLGDTDDLTRPCAVLGTPNYVAPEQAAGQTLELTAAADVYSLGAVLFELLTGRPPFVGDNPLDVLRQLGTKSPVSPRHLLPAVPKALDRICLRCLQRLPANRYVSARALADDLERWLDGRAVSRLPIHTRLLNSFKARPHVGWWCGVVGVLALALPAWKFTGSTVFARPPTSMAIVVDELAPNSTSRLIAQQLTGEFKQSLANSHKFCLQEEISIGRSANVALSNSLTYGRAVHAQTMLTCRVRQAGDQVHLSAQFVRCDTGELLWKRRVVLPTERAVMYLPATTQTMVQDLTKDWSNGFQGSRLTNFNPLPDAQTFYTRAMELASHGNRRDLEAAITLFERARQADPHYSQACAMLAFARWTLGCSYGEDDQLASAESTAKVALALDPDCAQAHRVIASCYLQQVRLDEARQEFEAAAELDPESAGCCQSLGICLRQMGHPDQAIPWLQRAVRIDPARGVCNTSLGEALILCDLDEQAEEAMCRAAELTTEKPDTQFGLVALRVWQKRYDEARGLCTVARSRFPEYQYALNFAAWIEFCDGRLSKARALYAELLANNSYQKQWVFHGGINPASALAYIAFRSGSVEQARSLADQAMRTDQELLARYPNNCRILHDMAATCAVIGNEQNALRYLEQSLAAGWAEHRSTMIDPRFGDIAGLPSFEALLKSTKPKYAANESLQR